jgi:hypothetical protein
VFGGAAPPDEFVVDEVEVEEVLGWKEPNTMSSVDPWAT